MFTMIDIDQYIPLGNMDKKVVYYNLNTDKLYYTHLNKDSQAIKVIVSYSLFWLLDDYLFKDIFDLHNFMIQVFMLVIVCFISVKAGKYMYEADNTDSTAKEFYVDDDTLSRLLNEWKAKSILAIALLIVFLLLVFISAFYFLATASFLALLLFSLAVLLFEVCNKHVFKRYKILKQLIEKYSIN